MIPRILLTLTLALLTALPLRADVDIQQVETPGGLTAWLVEDRTIPFVALEIRFAGGTSLDQPGKRGATHLMTALLNEGAGDLDAQAFATREEELAAGFSFDASDDVVSVSARFLTETRAESVALLRAALVAPRFDADAIERVRAQVISGIRSDATDPDAMAARDFYARAFGDHPYGSASEGTEDSVTALTRDDILAAHRAALARDRVHIAAAGDIDAATLAALLDEVLGDLPAVGAPMPGPVTPALDGQTHVVPFDTPQAVAFFGHEGLARDDPDFFAAYVMNVILGGGGFEARLMTEVREKRGLTYGVYSYLVPKDHAALYLGQVASANDRVAEAIEVIRDEWRRMAEEGVTEEELRLAKTYLTGGYPLRFDGNAAIAQIMVGMQRQGLTPDYIRTRNDQVNAVSAQDIARVAERLLRPEALTFTVVGQPQGLAATQ